jgi:hypothetical protein
MDVISTAEATLHVFEQDGEWHWGITIDRPAGNGVKVVAYSHAGFATESRARADGESILRSEAWRSRQSF